MMSVFFAYRFVGDITTPQKVFEASIPRGEITFCKIFAHIKFRAVKYPQGEKSRREKFLRDENPAAKISEEKLPVLLSQCDLIFE